MSLGAFRDSGLFFGRSLASPGGGWPIPFLDSPLMERLSVYLKVAMVTWSLVLVSCLLSDPTRTEM